jgi:hypothetical protein
MSDHDHHAHDHDHDAEQQIQQIVAEHGWYVALFEEEDGMPAFGYTIGLWKTFKHPEIIAFGLPVDVLATLLNLAGDKVKAGENIRQDFAYNDLLTELPVTFKKVHTDNIADYFGYAMGFYDMKPFNALQLFWPDEQAAFPWNENFDDNLRLYQPHLYEVIDFKFFEPRNTATFVDRRIFKENRPIVYVSHDKEDGSWQFLTGEAVTENDVMIVSLEEVVKKDPSVNELFNLPGGHYATRRSVGDEWLIRKDEA